MTIKCEPLGAGQDIGKSCVVVSLGGKKIMFDCGMHMGFNDERRYPDFSAISRTGDFTEEIDCVIITHFHIDHIGALPHFTEVCGYEGPIYMTYPTKALAPLMLEDHRKVMVDKKGEQDHYTALHIQQCMKRVTAVNLRQTVYVGDGLEFRAFYAGHVLGAAMFYVKAGTSTVVYTGDYNMVPDRHLGAAQIDRLEPDLLITESTYATTIRDSKLAKEAEFLKMVHSCISNEGKVLIPIFALGRAQELCILLDEYWEQMNLKVPIYFSAGLTQQSNIYYKLLISWTNQKVKDTCVTRNTFDFKHVSPFDKAQIDAPGPCVLFATPGMLTGGLSLEVFKRWAPSERNMIILPGFCIAGTVGHKLLSGKTTRIELDKRTQVDVRCQVQQLSFSAHTDAKGIMDLVRTVAPRNVVLVHGEAAKMTILKARIISELGIPCFDPANHEAVTVPSHFQLELEASKELVSRSLSSGLGKVEAHLVTASSKIKLFHPSEAPIPKLELSFESEVDITVSSSSGKLFSELGEEQPLQNEATEMEPSKKKHRMDLDLERLPEEVEQEQQFVFDINEVPSTPSEDKVLSVQYDPEVITKVISRIRSELSRWIVGIQIVLREGAPVVECGNSVRISFGTSQSYFPLRDGNQQRITLLCAWSCEDNLLANRVLGILRKLALDI